MMSERAPERFVSLAPPTPRDAGERYLAFLQDELAERDCEDALLAVYATQDEDVIRLWAFFAGEELRGGGPELDAVHDSTLKINASYFIPNLARPSFFIETRSLPAQGRSLAELEELYLRGEPMIVQIYRSPNAN